MRLLAFLVAMAAAMLLLALAVMWVFEEDTYPTGTQAPTVVVPATTATTPQLYIVGCSQATALTGCERGYR